jgi:hypothetical protein
VIRCNKCKKHKPPEFFYVVKRGKQAGYRWPYCNSCANKMRSESAKRNPRSPAKTYLTNRRARLKREYGITLEQYEEMRTAQGNRCKLCGRPPLAEYPNLDVDHCHKTGVVRGLLCRNCNIHIGFVENNRDAINSYLGAAVLSQPG